MSFRLLRRLKGILAVAFVSMLLLVGCTGENNLLSSEAHVKVLPSYQQAINGDPEAQLKLASYYLNFKDITPGLQRRSYRNGIMWAKRSAAQGYPKAVTLINLPDFQKLDRHVNQR